MNKEKEITLKYDNFDKKEYIEFDNRPIYPMIEEHCLGYLTDKQAWKVGQFLWNIQPNNDTTNKPPVFLNTAMKFTKPLINVK